MQTRHCTPGSATCWASTKRCGRAGRWASSKPPNIASTSTPEPGPSGSRPAARGHTAREVETAEVKRQLEADVIEPTSSELGFPVVLVPKKDGTLRFCVDYRLLDVVTKKDSYPLPRMDECIDSLIEATIFSTLDCNAGYWQVAIAPEDREKTAFVCHEGAYQNKRMPFGLTNAPAPVPAGHHHLRGQVAELPHLPRRCHRVLQDGGRA